MVIVSTEHPVAKAAVEAIHQGDVETLAQLLEENSWLATGRLGDDDSNGMSRSLLHVVADWPGHYPNGVATVALLVDAGADLNARFQGPHEETPLHWAASSDDVEVLDALLDAGADIEAAGSVLGGGSPLSNARGFGQWKAAHRLVERGAKTYIMDEAALGLIDRLEERFTANPPTPEEIDLGFWAACQGGSQSCAEVLLKHGAELNWLPPWEDLTPLDAAEREGAEELVRYLRSLGAKSASEL